MLTKVQFPTLKALIWFAFALLLQGCDPLVSLQGSFWPPWIIVMVVALPLTVLVQAFFKWLGLNEPLEPAILVYPSLWALITFIAWLVAFPW